VTGNVGNGTRSKTVTGEISAHVAEIYRTSVDRSGHRCV